ncbi:MAG: S8 family serine peptidase [Atopobiaceae bacterium]|nr:S8 family serine peptidase [Atopobiaceae bacterium]
MRKHTCRNLAIVALLCALFVTPVTLCDASLEMARAEEDIEKPFEMPEDAECEPGEVIVLVRPEADVAEVGDTLVDSPVVAEQGAAVEEITSDVLKVELESGTDVEDAVNELLGEAPPEVVAVQPNYVYHLASASEEQVAPLDEIPADEEVPSLEETPAAEEPPTEDETQPLEEEPLAEEEPLTVEETPVESIADDDAISKNDTSSLEDADAPVKEESRTPAVEEAHSIELQSNALSDAEALTVSAQGGEGVGAAVNDPYIDELWGLESMRALEAWDLVRCEGKVSVAVIDDCFDVTHPDLAPNIVAGSPYNAHAALMGLDNEVHDVSAHRKQGRDHGTHVAGIVGAVANNGLGVAGVSYNAGVVPIKAFDDNDANPQATTKDLIRAYDYILSVAEKYHIRVVNMSIGKPYGGDFEDSALIKMVETASEKGIVTVAAAGNRDSGESSFPFCFFPGDSASIVNVIDLRRADNDASGNDASGKFNVVRSDSSNYNVAGQGGVNTNYGKNISAPGTSILSTTYGHDYGGSSGTSMASPYVAGVIALEFAANPELTAGEAVDILYASAHDLGDDGWDEQYGYGEVDALTAVEFARSETEFAVDGGTISMRLVRPKGGYEFDRTQKEPEVEVVLKAEGSTKTLARGVDFSVTYADNVDAGLATATVTGAGDFAGKFVKDLYFTIAARSISGAQITLAAEELAYTGGPLKPEVISVLDGNAQLTAGVDFSGEIEYANNIHTGTATVKVTGRGNYAGTKKVTFKITAASVSSAKVAAIGAKAYTGKAIKPKPKVTLGGRTLKAGTDYELSYAYNVRPGTATVKVTGKGNYAGTKKVTFRIVAPTVRYLAHCQTFGWEKSWVSDGKVSGTTGESRRLEAICIKLGGGFPVSGGIEYLSHLQEFGWASSWTSNGAVSGTTGQSRRMEAIRIRLTGDMAKKYDVWYRAHVQLIGWMGWAKNGDPVGTTGQSRRLEAIQIVLVPKDHAAPGPTADSFRKR